MWVFSIPLGFIATDLGWIVREVGRQPWIIYNVMRTSEGVSNLTASATAATFFGYSFVYSAMLILYIVFAARIIRKGPDMHLPIPHLSKLGALKWTTGFTQIYGQFCLHSCWPCTLFSMVSTWE